MKVHSAEKIKRLKLLRTKGYSINQLVEEFSIPKTTIWHHIRDVTVSPNYADKLKAKRGGSAKRAEKRRQVSHVKAKAMLADPAIRDYLRMAACLYWGEGTKREFGFFNADPKMIGTFLSCLAELGVSQSRLKIGIRIYEDINETEAKEYWAKVTQTRPDKILGVEVIRGKKKGKLPYGMCRIRLANGNDYFNLMMATIELLSKDFAPVAQRIRATDS